MPSLCAAAALLSVAAAGPAHGGAGCATAGDCGLLGACKEGKCACYPGYTASNCASLDLLPAPLDAGLRQEPNHSNWCGTILPDETNKTLWHMYNSDFSECGLGIWTTGSQVIHSTASNPIGPYTPTGQVAVHAEAHNPQAVRAPDGTFLLMDSYNGPDAGCPATVDLATCQRKPENGTKCEGHGCICAPKMASPDGGSGNFTYHTAKTAAGTHLTRLHSKS